MSAYTRKNALDQSLDIAGSLNKNDSKILSNEFDGYGEPILGQAGINANIISVVSGVVTVSGLSGMTTGSVGRMLTLFGAFDSNNNGTFLIVGFNSSTSINIYNLSAMAADINNGLILWIERNAYTLEDDLNFSRTDRKLIKGTLSYYNDVPAYQRPTAIGTNVSANLSNIAAKTLDAHAWVVNRVFRSDNVSLGDGYSTIILSNSFQYANSLDKTGVPINDGFDINNHSATYVEIINPLTENSLIAVGDNVDGYRIFGRTRQGTTGVEPNSIEIEFRAVSLGDDIQNSIPYIWDGYQPNIVDYYYGYRERADQLTETAFRTTLINGLFLNSGGGGTTLTAQINGIAQGTVNTINVIESDLVSSTKLGNTLIIHGLEPILDNTGALVYVGDGHILTKV